MRARQRPKRQSPSQIADRAHFVVQGPQFLPSRVPAPSPGNGSRLFVALASDWFKCGPTSSYLLHARRAELPQLVSTYAPLRWIGMVRPLAVGPPKIFPSVLNQPAFGVFLA